MGIGMVIGMGIGMVPAGQWNGSYSGWINCPESCLNTKVQVD